MPSCLHTHTCPGMRMPPAFPHPPTHTCTLFPTHPHLHTTSHPHLYFAPHPPTPAHYSPPPTSAYVFPPTHICTLSPVHICKLQLPTHPHLRTAPQPHLLTVSHAAAFSGTPLYTFGQGLSYTNFSLACTNVTGDTGVAVNCSFTNAGPRDGDHVLLAFHSVGADIRGGVDHPVPIKRLIDFGRATVAQGATGSLSFDVTPGVWPASRRRVCVMCVHVSVLCVFVGGWVFQPRWLSARCVPRIP